VKNDPQIEDAAVQAKKNFAQQIGGPAVWSSAFSSHRMRTSGSSACCC